MIMNSFKVMVTGKNDSVIWDLETEINIFIDHRVYKSLSREIDLLFWKQEYLILFNNWLITDDRSIYDINHPINMDMIKAIISTNKQNQDFILYYWFDVDRDIYPNYKWEKCPLSKDNLITLPDSFNRNNGKISPKFPLVFPNYV